MSQNPAKPGENGDLTRRNRTRKRLKEAKTAGIACLGSIFRETVEEAVPSRTDEVFLATAAAQMHRVPGGVSAAETVVVSNHRPAVPVARPVAARRGVRSAEERAPE